VAGDVVADAALIAFQQSHRDIFPSKSMLKLKVRELRQKIMAESQSQANGTFAPTVTVPMSTDSGLPAETFGSSSVIG
jgi:hypothetical protein